MIFHYKLTSDTSAQFVIFTPRVTHKKRWEQNSTAPVFLNSFIMKIISFSSTWLLIFVKITYFYLGTFLGFFIHFLAAHKNTHMMTWWNFLQTIPKESLHHLDGTLCSLVYCQVTFKVFSWGSAGKSAECKSYNGRLVQGDFNKTHAGFPPAYCKPIGDFYLFMYF